jgi:hypothetical protein
MMMPGGTRFSCWQDEGTAESKMSHKDMDYYERRAEAEIELAQRSNDTRAVRIHYELASAYLDLIHGDTPKAGPNSLSR